jgi:hypothetical protein
LWGDLCDTAQSNCRAVDGARQVEAAADRLVKCDPAAIEFSQAALQREVEMRSIRECYASLSRRERQMVGPSSPRTVGINSETVGWIWTVFFRVVYGTFAAMTSMIE